MLAQQFETDPQPAGSTSPSEALSGRILCVDDEKQILMSLRRVLRRAGHEATLANSAAEGLEFLSDNEVDIVISDMRMPEMDGNHFLTEVASQWPRTIRMLLTGYSDMESTIGAINGGKIYRYIAKPWDDTDLLMCVQGALESKFLRAERDRLNALTSQQNDQLRVLNESLEDKVKDRTKELEQSKQQIEVAYSDSIAVFSRIIGMRESNMVLNTEAVAKAADLVAERLDLSKAQRKNLHYASLLHDIGTIALPDNLLQTPYESMDDNQREQFQEHCINGEALLVTLAPLHEAASIIRSHHEQVGGGGYPDGLDGDDIPIESKILFVVNEFNDLQSGLLLGKPQSSAFSLDYLHSNIGRRYDGRVVEAFVEINESLEQNEAVQKELILGIGNVEPGMILAEDVYLRENVLMLRSGQVLTQTFIDKYKTLKSGTSDNITLKIKTN